MKFSLLLFSASLLIGCSGGVSEESTDSAPVAKITTNPIPEPIAQGPEVEIRDYARLPETRGRLSPDEDVAGYARVSFVRDAPDGRRFANDSRGYLYVIDAAGEPQLYADVAEVFPLSFYGRLESGFIGFAFHPAFVDNGLFYTVHAESAPGNSHIPDFTPPGFALNEATYHSVITEWRADDPSADTFGGTRRELLRSANVVENLTHPMGAVEFDPTAEPGDPDYGLLFTSGSDYGFSNGGGPNANDPTQTQRLDSIITAILRIDPRSPSESGGEKGLGDYTIPPGNVFAADGDPATLGEIYAYGFRNGHRLSWDLTDGIMFASDIGMNHVEEINIVHNGGNYGWMPREGHWENARGTERPEGLLNELYQLPPDVLDGRLDDGYDYPVAIYDHDEGNAVTNGFTYHGDIPALQGKFIFGDIRRGRLFTADTAALKAANDGVPGTVAAVEEIQLYVRDASGDRVNVTLQELVDETLGEPATRAGLHIGRGTDGTIFITSRQDGVIRILVP